MKSFSERLSARVRELADMPMDTLRAGYPEATETQSELVRLCKQRRITRGQMIEAIILEEFEDDFAKADAVVVFDD